VPEAEKSRKRALIIKGPELPMEVGTGSRALAIPVTPPEPAPGIRRITGVEDLFEDDEPAGEPEPAPAVSIIQEPSGDADWIPPTPDLSQFPGESQSPPYGDETSSDYDAIDPEENAPEGMTGDDEAEDSGDAEPAGEESPEPEEENGEGGETSGDIPSSGDSAGTIPPGISFNRAQWFDLLKWAHHSGALTPEQRMQIVRMGRLIQKGRKLTRKQDGQVREMIVLVQTLGYRFT